MIGTITDFDMTSLMTPTGPLVEPPLPQVTGPVESPSDLTIYSGSDPMVADAAVAVKFIFDTKPLDECIRQAENLKDLLHSDAMALKVVGILSYGLRKSGELLAEAIYRFKMARSDRKQAEAIAALENFSQYVADRKDLKSTDATRTHYVAIDKGVLKACEREAFYEAVVSQLETYKMQFTMVMSAIKAMIAKQRADGLIDGSDVSTTTG
jgi:hypothetical protein